MQQLSAMDNLFLHAESSRTPMHITIVMIYDQSTAAGGAIRFKEILSHFEQNLSKSPVFRRKLLHTPFGIDQPYWLEDENFDLEFHVRHIALPRPGDWRQFCILISRLHSQGLDLSRPLWEAYVIEGLDEVDGLPKGSFAIVLKVHHAAIDGVSGSEIINALHSLDPNDRPASADDHWQPERPPGNLDLMWRSYKNNIGRPTQLFKTLSNAVPAFGKARQLDNKGQKTGPKVKTRFNKRISGHRVSDAIHLQFEQIRKIKNSVANTTVNDVVVSIVGGGLRRYLIAKDESPDASLVTGAPINIRSKADTDNVGNLISMMRISLGTDIDDPKERLKAVHASAVQSKAYAKAIGVRTMTDIAQSLSPRLLALGMRAATGQVLNERIQTPVHTMVSNVPGPPVDLYMRGARLHRMIGLGPLVDQVGLFHAVMSVGKSMSISFTCCREMLPDPDFYRACLQESFEELRDAVA